MRSISNLSLRIAAGALPQASGVGGMDRRLRDQPHFRNEGIDTSQIQSSPCWSSTRPTATTTTYGPDRNSSPFVATEVNGTHADTFNGVEIDLSKWTKLSMREAIIKWGQSCSEKRPNEETFSIPSKFFKWFEVVFKTPSVSKMPTSEMMRMSNDAARVKACLVLKCRKPVGQRHGQTDRCDVRR